MLWIEVPPRFQWKILFQVSFNRVFFFDTSEPSSEAEMLSLNALIYSVTDSQYLQFNKFLTLLLEQEPL